MLISQLATICKQYAVPLAVVDGKALADLAHGVMEAKLTPQMQDLLVCVANIQDVAGLLRQPGRRFLGEGGAADAATAIQSAWRGFAARRKYSKHGRAAAAIQGAWRMHRLRGQLMERLQAARRARDARFQELQRGLYSQWPLITRAGHVVVHLPSMHRRQAMTLSQLDAQIALEAAQLARLCDLAEPLAEVLLLLPSPPDTEVVAYWDKLLEVGGIADPASRYRMVWPENYGRLPPHMSTTAQLLASPRALKRLQAAVAGRMGYLVPGVVGDEDIDLAVTLGLPLLAPAPYTAKTLARKSAGRALFRSAGVHTAPGAVCTPRAELPPPPRRVSPNGWEPLKPGTSFSFTSEGDMIITDPSPAPAPARSQTEKDEERVVSQLAEAMVRSPGAPKWLLKIDDEVGGGGHAWVDTLSIVGAAAVLERTLVEEGGAASPDPAVILTDAQKVAVYRINELLRKQLSKKLQLAARDVYPTYHSFIVAFAARGGVIEACPNVVVGSPQANLFIDPQGNVSVLSTHERIFAQPYRAVGSTFPQTSVPHRALLDAATAVGQACYRAGAVGHVAVDFVTWQAGPEAGGALRLWAVDLSPFPTPSLMAFQLFDFLSVGTFNPATGAYVVEPEEEGTMSSTLTGITGTLPHGTDGQSLQDMSGGQVPEMVGTSLSGPRPPTSELPSNLPSPRGSSAGTQGVGDLGPLPPHQISTGGDTMSSRTGLMSMGGASSARASMDGEAGPAAAAAVAARHSAATHRYFFALDACQNGVLAATPASRFFHACWQEGHHFDVDHRVGVIFNLSDKYMLGVLGIIAVGVAPLEMYATMHNVLSFIAAGERRVAAAATAAAGGRAEERRTAASADSVRAFRDVQALVKYMNDKSQQVAAALQAGMPIMP